MVFLIPNCYSFTWSHFAKCFMHLCVKVCICLCVCVCVCKCSKCQYLYVNISQNRNPSTNAVGKPISVCQNYMIKHMFLMSVNMYVCLCVYISVHNCACSSLIHCGFCLLTDFVYTHCFLNKYIISGTHAFF